MRSPTLPVVALTALTALAALAACGRGDEAPELGRPDAPAPAAATAPVAALPTVEFRPAGRPPATIAVEVALTPHAIQRGMMYREHLAPDAGMIFVFRGEKVQSFWMKNTLIPLDMIFVGDDRVVVGVVANAEPRTLGPRTIGKPSRYVIEVNGGWAAAHGVEAGTPVAFAGVPVERATVD